MSGSFTESCQVSLCSRYNSFLETLSTAWKVPAFGDFLVRIFPHSDWIRKDTPYLSVFSPNAGKYGPEKLQIWIFFTQIQWKEKIFTLRKTLTHFSPTFYFYNTWKRQKAKGFLKFSGRKEIENLAKVRRKYLLETNLLLFINLLMTHALII